MLDSARPATVDRNGTRRIVVVGYAGTELLDLACVTSTLDITNRVSGRRLYDVEVIAHRDTAIRCDSGLRVSCDRVLEQTEGPIDTMIVVGGLGHTEAAADAGLLHHVRRLAGRSRRVASVCTGAGILAAAGLLRGRRAATHWRYLPELATRHPDVDFTADWLYVRDGRVITSAGVTAALDLTLALVEEDAGSAVSRSVARGVVAQGHRPGDQGQLTVHTAPEPVHDLVRTVARYVRDNLERRLDSRHLADVAGVSERHLHRLFLTHVGTQPARFVRRCRVDAAAHLLGTTSLPVRAVALRCGFTSSETLRQAFTRELALSPTRYRQRHRGAGSDAARE